MSTKDKPNDKASNDAAANELSLSIFIREDEIFTGEEAVFTLKYSTKEKLQKYFATENLTDHEFFLKTDVIKPAKTRIIVRVVHPDTKKILVMYGIITKNGTHPVKPDVKGIYYKIAQLDANQITMIRNFIA